MRQAHLPVYLYFHTTFQNTCHKSLNSSLQCNEKTITQYTVVKHKLSRDLPH